MYWLSETQFSDPELHDYLTNVDKRFQTGIAKDLGKEWWDNYVQVYRDMRSKGHILIRAKVMDTGVLRIIQVWKCRESRQEFQDRINADLFDKILADKEIIRIEREISEHEKDDIVDWICEQEQKIIQFVREDQQRKGMIIGDALKGSPVFKV